MEKIIIHDEATNLEEADLEVHQVCHSSHGSNSTYVIQVGFIKSLKLNLFFFGKVDRVPAVKAIEFKSRILYRIEKLETLSSTSSKLFVLRRFLVDCVRNKLKSWQRRLSFPATSNCWRN